MVVALTKAEKGAAARTNARPTILAAAQAVLRREGFAKLSTRAVAREAGVPLSQIHYHFGSKQGLVLALLDHLDAQLLARQTRMYDRGGPLSARWRQACDFLDDDIASGYVRLLHECLAQGWSDPVLAEKSRHLFYSWNALLAEVAREVETRFGGLGPFSAAEIAALVSQAFVGGESLLLLGIDEDRVPVRAALRRFGALIELMERGP
jgi:AcrR family transcriptional regulator